MKPDKVISIVITEEQIEFIELSLRGNKNTIISFGSYSFSYSHLDQFDEIISSISEITKKNKFTRLSIVHQDVLRTTMLLNDSGDMKSKILQNFKQTFDIQLSEYYIDFVTETLEKNILVYISAIPKRLVDPLFEVFNKYKFKLLSLEPGISSALRTMVKQFDHELFLYLHISYSRMVITIYNQGMIFAVRYINFGFEDMVSGLADVGGVSMDDAEGLFFKYGASDVDFEDEVEKNINESILESLDKMSMEIQRTIDFYSMTYKKSGIENFVLSGVINEMPDLNEYLSKLFSVTVQFSECSKLISVTDEMPDMSSMKHGYLCLGAGLR